MVPKDVDTMWFLPSALNVKVKKFNQARVNGGSNYDSLKVLYCMLGENRQPEKGILPSDGEPLPQAAPLSQDDLVAGKGCWKIWYHLQNQHADSFVETPVNDRLQR